MHRVSLGAGRISNNVDANRNGVVIATTPNDGHYDDSTSTTGRGWSLDPGMRLRFDGESIMTGAFLFQDNARRARA
jgi:hypothetical protein